MEEKKTSNIEALEAAINLLQGFLSQAKDGDPISCNFECHSTGIAPDPIASAQADTEVLMNMGGKYAVIIVSRPNRTVESMMSELHPERELTQ